jgi:RHS repeat-associated protein
VTWEYRPGDGLPVTQITRGAGASAAELCVMVTDPAGTPTELIGADGRSAWRSASTLWGFTGANGRDGTPLRFPGQYHDRETGLHYNRHRYYDPAIGRYLSQDPLGLAPAPNPVAYVNHPLTMSDPLGLAPYGHGYGDRNSYSPPGTIYNAEPDDEFGYPERLHASESPPHVAVPSVHPYIPTVNDLRPPTTQRRSQYREGYDWSRPMPHEHLPPLEPSRPYHGSDAARMDELGRSWYRGIKYPDAGRDLGTSGTSANDTYRSVQSSFPSVATHSSGETYNIRHSPYPTARHDPVITMRDSSGRGHNPRTYQSLGDSLASRDDGGRGAARELADFFDGVRSVDDLRNQESREFSVIAGTAESARGYSGTNRGLPTELREISGMSPQDAADRWRNIPQWYEPAARGDESWGGRDREGLLPGARARLARDRAMHSQGPPPPPAPSYSGPPPVRYAPPPSSYHGYPGSSSSSRPEHDYGSSSRHGGPSTEQYVYESQPRSRRDDPERSRSERHRRSRSRSQAPNPHSHYRERSQAPESRRSHSRAPDPDRRRREHSQAPDPGRSGRSTRYPGSYREY